MRRLSTREKYMLGVLLLLVGSVAYYLLVLAPLHERRTQLALSIDNTALELARLEILAVQRESIEQEIAELTELLSQEYTSEMSLSYILVFLENTARRLEIEIQGLNVDGVSEDGGSISLALSGPYSSVTAFLRLLQSDASGIIIDSARVIGQGDQAFVTLSANAVSGRFLPVEMDADPRSTPFKPD